MYHSNANKTIKEALKLTYWKKSNRCVSLKHYENIQAINAKAKSMTLEQGAQAWFMTFRQEC